MLKTKNNYIVDKSGNKLTLKGFNLGGWLLMEGYILHSPNIAEQVFKKKFKRVLGAKALDDFERSFRNNFIQESDFKNISDLGFNCIRLPFNHKLIEPRPYHYSREGLSYLKKAVVWARKYHLWIILDMHATPGSQNQDWHSDSIGKALLWQSKVYRRRTIALWCYLADVFKNESAVAGYDLLNEPIAKNAILNEFYKELIHEIRKVDKGHIIFIEPTNWAQDLKHLRRPEDNNIAFSVHAYSPLDFSFNFKPGIRYASGKTNHDWKISDYKKYLSNYARISKEQKAPILVGEFGVNSRANLFGEMDYIRDTLKLFEELGFHWNYWTYKAVKNIKFPDGLYHYGGNPKWVNRQGPLSGWDNYASLWNTQKRQIINSWKTSYFNRDDKLLAVLREANKIIQF